MSDSPAKKLWKIQRQLADYSLSVFEELSRKTEFMLLYSSKTKDSDFNDTERGENDYPFPAINVPPGRFLFFDPRLGLLFLQLAAKQHPHKIILTGDTRYMSFWMILLSARLLRIEVYIHGHALFKKRDASPFLRKINRAVYAVVLYLCSGYIAYTKEVKESFSWFNLSDRKVAIAENSLTNAHPVIPQEKSPSLPGILFCGRLRENHGIDLLIHIAEKMRQEHQIPIELHIIGGGKDAERIRQMTVSRSWVTLYGKVYDTHKIREISLHCSIGCYTGTAGLSIIQYMSLSLVPVTHDHLTAHGPEASYIQNGHNGILYNHQHPESALEESLLDLYRHPEKTAKLQSAAFETYQHLISPPLSARLLRAVGW